MNNEFVSVSLCRICYFMEFWLKMYDDVRFNVIKQHGLWKVSVVY